MALVYATSADYSELGYGDLPPDNIDRLLAEASRFVRRATMSDVYSTDVTGLPLDGPTLSAFTEATCCQAAAMAALGINPDAGGSTPASRTVASKSLDGAGIAFANAAAAEADRTAAARQLVPEARAILQDAGYATTRVWSYG